MSIIAPIGKPWLDWQHDLPQAGEELDAKNQQQYHILNDPQFHRDLTAEQRARLIASYAALGLVGTSTAIVLQGGSSSSFEMYDSDTDVCEFRQESFFRYLFMANIPDCTAVIDLSSSSAPQSLLFVPYVTDDAERWQGERWELSAYSAAFGVDHTYYNTDIHSVLQSRGITALHVLKGVNTDSGATTRTTATFPGIETYSNINQQQLHVTLTEQRVIKTALEIKLLRIANHISSQAHVYVMRHIQPLMIELQLEALYKSYTQYYGGSRHTAYTCICGSGHNGSVLHYGHAARPNNSTVAATAMCVLDMGAEYVGYATDITRSYPADGVFTADQRAIYNAVLTTQQQVLLQLRPGVNYSDMHVLAERTLLQQLLLIGIVHNGSVDDMMAVHMAAVFMPHGLGHLVGLNVHDVGGIDSSSGSSRATTPGLAYLRLNRVLQEGMLLTVEPGCYFNTPTLQRALAAPQQQQYINSSVLQRFLGSGGVRIEDDVLITADGCENLTTAPVTVDDIEEVFRMRGKQ